MTRPISPPRQCACFSDPNLRTRLSEQARAYARTWSAPILADRMVACDRTLMSG